MTKAFVLKTIFSVLAVLLKCIRGDDTANSTWDVLIFTQEWPVSFCAEWTEESTNNSCLIPAKNEIWTIHGIWPSLHNSSIGPNFCHSAIKFHESDISSIESKLSESWFNIKNGTTDKEFWKYEWQKHGTCASQLPQLDSVLKYFSLAIDWNEKFNIYSILSKAGLTPSDQGHDPQEIWEAIRSSTGKNASVHCFQGKEGLVYLTNIRLCFDKDLELRDCDGVKGETSYGSCPKGKKVIYPDKLTREEPRFELPDFVAPDFEMIEPMDEENAVSSWPTTAQLVEMLKVIRFTQWLTL